MLAVTYMLAILALSGCLLRSGKQPSKVSYKLPTKLTIAMGEALPGTDIRYESLSEEGAYLVVRGQKALKRTGDSLDWSGSPLPGVSVELKLRVAWYTEAEIHVVGMAEIVVDGIEPREGLVSTSSPITYAGPVVYSLAKGAAIPGAALTYQERTDDGAKLGGIDGYPYRKVGDSVFYEGQLRENVYIRLDLRVVQFDDRALRIGGIVTLWMGS